MPSFKKPKLKFSKKLPNPKGLGANRSILIFDQILLEQPALKNWIGQFHFQYPVQAGEPLKAISSFPKHMENILKISTQIEKGPLQIIAVGGGSVGDFSGFVASVLKRGVELVQIPSTWLSAIDSSHGGKTALNVGGFKNQIGTFYQASEIIMCQTLLQGQGPQRLDEALGEALKISLIDGLPLWKRFSKMPKWNEKVCWKLLPDLIAAKYKVVSKDPFEKKGLRHVLNLGHTLGHLFESQLQVSHGKAVLLGLRFATEWGLHLEILKLNFKEEVESYLPSMNVYHDHLMQLKDLDLGLKTDKKKNAAGKIRFIFFKSPGKFLIQEKSVQAIVGEVERQRRMIAL